MLAVGAGGGCLDIFTLIYPFFPLSPSLWETARYRLKYCLKGPFNPKQPTNQQPPPAPTVSAVGPCPTGIQIVGRPGTGNLPSTIAPPNHPRWWGRSGGAKVLGKLPVPGRPTILIIVGQGPSALVVGAGGGCLDIFTLIYPFSSLSPSLWETS